MVAFVSISDELGIPIAIMLDTKGLRFAPVFSRIEGHPTTEVPLLMPHRDDVIGNAQRFSLDYRNSFKEVRRAPSSLMTVSLVLGVDHVEGTDMHCKIINGGELGEKESVNVPNVSFQLPSQGRTAQTS